MSATIAQRKLYFQNIQGLLDRISEIVGFKVDLFTAPNSSWSMYAAKNAEEINIWDHASYMKDRKFIIAGVEQPNQHIIQTFNIVQFPGCCALCISTGVITWSSYQGKGVNTLGNQIRQEIAKLSGYTTMVCTDVEKNERQRKTLKRNGWQDVYGIKNRRTANRVIMSIKELEHQDA